MHSFSWTNGQRQTVLPPSQSSQAASQVTHHPMGNQQPGIADYSCQQNTLNHGIRPPHRCHFNFHDGAYSNRQRTNWQTSEVPHQTVYYQQPAGWETYDPKILHDYGSNSFLKWKNVNHPVVNGPQAATHQDFHMNSGIINPSSHMQPNIMKANTIYTQQDMSAQWKQQCTGLREQSAWTRLVTDPQKFKLDNVEAIKRNSACTTTATSLPPEQAVSTSNSMSIIAHNRRSAPIQYYKQNGPRHELTPPLHPPTYETAVSQSLRNKSRSIISSSNENCLHPLSDAMSQETQQHAINLNSIQNNMQEAACHSMSKTNELVDTPEQTYRRHMIARIADDLRNSFPVTSDGCLPGNNSSPYRGNQFVNLVRMTDHNQNNQPEKLTVTESCNSRASLLLNSRPSLPKITHSVMSRTQDSLNAPQPTHVPRNIVESNSDASQWMNWPENISLHTRKTKSSVENSHDMPEKCQMLSTVKANDDSIHSSPGRSGTRAVAVVQPLSQEGNHVASSHVSSEIINQSANKNVRIHSAASSNGTALSSSDSAVHEDKQICTDDTEFDPSIDMQVDQHGAPTTQQSVSPEVPVNQIGGEEKSGNRTDSEVLELSSIPTIPWTIDTLTKLIQDEEKAQMKLSTNITISNPGSKLLFMFWEGDVGKLIASLKTSWYLHVVNDVREFCSKHVTPDTIVLSQVKAGFETQLQSHHILKHNEVHSEPPYKSSWLNVNEQLDDIDKEFGFPSSLKHRIRMPERHSQPVLGYIVNSVPAQTVNDVPNSVQSQSAIEPVDSGKESLPNSVVEDTPTQIASPYQTINVDSTDPYYSFEIKVLPPEEARVIFEQIQSEKDQGARRSKVSEKNQGQHMESQLNVSELEKEPDIEEVCCISRWVEINLRSDGLPLSPCPCKNKQDLQNCTDNRDKEEMAGQKEDDPTAISISHVEGERQAKGGEVINNQTMTYWQSELRNDLRQTNLLTENDQKCHTNSDQEPKDRRSLNCYQLSIPNTNKSEDKGLSSSYTENLFAPELESTGGTQSLTSIGSDNDIEFLPRSESEVASHTSDLEENCGEADSEEQQPQITAVFSLSGNHETVERRLKRLSSHDRCSPVQSSKPPLDMDSLPSTFKEVTDKTEIEPVASKVRTVQLVLFGSTPHKMCDVIGGRKRHYSSSGMVSVGLLKPPEVISVKLSPLKRKPSESIAMETPSVKRRHQQWGRNFQLTKYRHRSALQTQNSTFPSLSGVSLKRTGTVNPTNTENLPIASKMRTWSLNGNAKCCLSLKKRTSLGRKKRVSHSDRLQQREQMMKQYAVILKERAAQERSCGESESPSDSPLQENIVLRFSVLPNTFNFKDGCHERKEANEPDPNNPVLVKGKHNDSNKTVTRVKGIWHPSNPEKTYCAVSKTPVPKTAGLFQEFKKKYMENQPSIDE